MSINARPILTERGVIGASGEQSRPANRGDVQEVIRRNGGSPEYIDFRNLDFSGADLRGLDLRLCRFNGCNFSQVLAFPLIRSYGQDLSVGDMATWDVLDKWSRGRNNPSDEVIPTRLERSFLAGARLDDANFSYAWMRGVALSQSNGVGTVFHSTDLRGANIRFSRFEGVDLRSADLRDTNLYGLELDTNYLDDVEWGDKQIVSHERNAQWDEAISVYRTLMRVHESVYMYQVAREFRYRLQRAITGELLQQARAQARTPNDQGLLRHWLSVIRHGGKPLWTWIVRRFVDWIFGFGDRAWHVVRAIVLTIVLFTAAYFEYTTIEVTLDGCVEFGSRLIKALYFSAVSSTALGYGSWVGQELGWVKYLGSLQSFLGTFLTALFLVTFARRWTQ